MSGWERDRSRQKRPQHVDALVARGRAALREFEGATQVQVDRLCQAIGWAVANETTFTRLANMGVEESGIGDPVSRVSKRFKVMGILRDVLRQPSIGVIDEVPEKGIVKYAKPVGLIASLVPTTNPELTPPGVSLFALKCRDAVVFSPHPRSKATTLETVSSCAARWSAKARPPTCSSASSGPASRPRSTS